MVIGDYYSKFFAISHLPNSKSKTVINYIKTHLGRYGIPEVIVSDVTMAPNLTAMSFNVTSPTRYSQSKGLAKRAVQTAKNILKKAKIDGKDFHLALLDNRNTPIDQIDLPPTQMLMGRRTTRLPTTPALSEPQYPTRVCHI